MANPNWTCTICNRTMQQNSMVPHLNGAAHAAMANGGNAVPTTNTSHPNGQLRIPISSVATVHNHQCEIPLQAYRDAGVKLPRGRGSMVTVKDVNAASDSWDARGILHDIDTQWGSIPGGGAYKESDFYYGPGEYDYY